MSKAQLESAYFAGLFDGEGCVSVSMRGNSLRLILSIANQHKGVLEFAVLRYGGGITTNGDVWHWQISGLAAADFARDIEPFSIIKRPQLLSFLEARTLLNARGEKGLTAENIAQRHEMKARVKRQKMEYVCG